MLPETPQINPDNTVDPPAYPHARPPSSARYGWGPLCEEVAALRRDPPAFLARLGEPYAARQRLRPVARRSPGRLLRHGGDAGHRLPLLNNP